MKSGKRSAYLKRDDVLKLLSEEEIARVSTAEAVRLADGDEYLDLTRLDRGVLRAHGKAVPTANLLPKKSVREETWTKVLAELAPTAAHRPTA